ncbi:response regulator [Spirosoma harenae]
MPRPIQCILLVDDDPDDIFLHKLIIEDSGLCDHIRTTETALQALQYLTNTSHPDYLRPDLILTDINLPGMNGFEFLEHYQQLNDDLKVRLAVLILTTSLNPRDTKRAALFPDIKGYYAKPLTVDMLQAIVDQHDST